MVILYYNILNISKLDDYLSHYFKVINGKLGNKILKWQQCWF